MMRADEVVVSVLPGDHRAAALAGDRLVRLALIGDDDELRAGDVILGRVKTVTASLGCAFVDWGGAPPGVLMAADAPRAGRFAEGDVVCCEVLREAVGTKGPKLTTKLSSPGVVGAWPEGARPPCRLLRGPDPILSLLRDASKAGVRRVVVDDGRELSRLRAAVPELADRLEAWREPLSLFAASGADEAILHALLGRVPLPSGGRVVISETEALVAIDVDTGAGSGGSAKASALACDLEAATAIGREIMARELAGLIVIDFVPLRRPADRTRVLAALERAFAHDDRVLRIGGWTRLGLLEMNRQRRGPSLAQRLTVRCAACGANGHAISPRWAAGDALRAFLAEARRSASAPPILEAAPAVLEQLRGPMAAATAAVEARLGTRIDLMQPDTLLAEGFRLIAPGTAEAR